MSKYAAIFALAFSLAAGWALGVYLMTALCVLTRNTLSDWRTRKGKGKRLFR